MKTRLQILKAARAKIAKASRWTRGEIARNAKGEPTSPIAKTAVCWCAYGALHAGAGRAMYLSSHGMIDDIARDLVPHPRWIAYANDDPKTTHADVLAWFDRLIAAEEAKVLA